MKEGKCKARNYCVLAFGGIGGKCYLNFGANTKFHYKCSESVAMLERKHMTFTITVNDFKHYFDVIE